MRNGLIQLKKMRQDKKQQIESQAAVCSFLVGAVAGGLAISSSGNHIAALLGVLLGGFLSSIVVTSVITSLHGDSDDVRYRNAEDSQNFINGITQMINELSKTLYDGIKKDVQNVSGKLCENFNSQITEQMKRILHRASE